MPGRHGIQGLADGFIPNLINLDEIDQIVRISTADAVAAAERLAREEGLLVGISSGANVLAATQVAYELGPGNILVTVLPDRGERYLSLCDGDAGAQTTETCAPDPQVFSDTKKSGEHK